MRSWIHHSRGRVLRQAHVGLEDLGGLKEDEFSRFGFSGRVAELYRRNEPTGWTRIEGRMRPWDIDGLTLEPSDRKDSFGHPLRLFYNDDVSIWVSRRSKTMPFAFRNADGDEVYFVHEGTGTFWTEFGAIPYEPGDYVVLPKGVTYQIKPDTETNYFFIVESVGEIGFADIGPIGRHAPFDPSLIYIPSLPDEEAYDLAEKQAEYELRIKSRNDYTSIFYPFDPIDVVGWKGDLFPFKINIRDYRPITSDRIHLMPSAHGIFTAKGFLIANFLSRPAEGERDVERIPPFHRNIDYDEVMFIHGGQVFNMPIQPASISMYPQGLHHGLPGSVSDAVRANWKQHEYYDQKLIGVDVERPLNISPEVEAAMREIDQIREGKTA